MSVPVVEESHVEIGKQTLKKLVPMPLIKERNNTNIIKSVEIEPTRKENKHQVRSWDLCHQPYQNL